VSLLCASNNNVAFKITIGLVIDHFLSHLIFGGTQ